jgi:hypothetical protein
MEVKSMPQANHAYTPTCPLDHVADAVIGLINSKPLSPTREEIVEILVNAAATANVVTAIPPAHRPPHDIQDVALTELPLPVQGFGLKEEGGGHIWLFDTATEPVAGDRIVILWGDRDRPPQFGTFLARGASIGGAPGTTGLQMLLSGPVGEGDKVWIDLHDDDTIGRQIGTLQLVDGDHGKIVHEPLHDGSSRVSEKAFMLENPLEKAEGTRFYGYDHVTCDPLSGIGPRSSVLYLDDNGEWCIGRVKSLRHVLELENLAGGEAVAVDTARGDRFIARVVSSIKHA